MKQQPVMTADIYGHMRCRGCGSDRPRFHRPWCRLRWKDWS